MRSKNKYDFIDKKWLIENWINTTKTLKQLADELNINDSLLEYRAAKFGLRKQSKYPFDKKKFYNLNDPHIWYLGGLIATDGYLVYNHDAIEISLVGDSELELLTSIKQYYNSLSPIKKYGTAWRFRILDDGIQKFFIDNFGLTKENKTETVKSVLKFPNESCAKAYILGCIDGDGSISFNPKLNQLSFSILGASKSFIKGFKNIVQLYTGINLPYRLEYKKYTGNYYPTVGTKGKKVNKFLEWVYSENTFCLGRKKQIYSNGNSTQIV